LYLYYSVLLAHRNGAGILRADVDNVTMVRKKSAASRWLLPPLEEDWER